MASQDSKEDSHITLTLGEVILGVLGIVLILTGYYLSTRFVEIVDDVILPFVILILTVLGTYFFFRSTISLILKTIRYLKGGNVSVNDVIFTSSLMFRIRKCIFINCNGNHFSYNCICIVFRRLVGAL